MLDPFDACLAFTLAQEGGWSDDPGDPGGPTNQGLTMSDLLHWNREASVDDLRAMPADLVSALYRALYWMPVRGWALWPGLDLMLFDAAVNTGVGVATKQLQRTLHVPVDGALGVITAQAARSVGDRTALLSSIHDAQSAGYRAMGNFPRFGRGWLARCDRRHAAACLLTATSVALPAAGRSIGSSTVGAGGTLADSAAGTIGNSVTGASA